MTRDETVALFEACEAKRGEARAAALADGKSEYKARDIAHEAAKAHWNAWADSLLAERKTMQASGAWRSHRNSVGQEEAENIQTQAWLDKAVAEFSRSLFHSRASEQSKKPAVENDTTNGESGDSAPLIVTVQIEDHGIEFSGFNFPGSALFKGTTFQGDASFVGASFHNYAWFESASFLRETSFVNAIFQGGAFFISTSFKEGAWFEGANFQDSARFTSASFEGVASFQGAPFQAGALFANAIFQNDAIFNGSTFQRGALFAGATFQARTWFANATFSGDVSFDGAAVKGNASFDGAAFTGNASFVDAAFTGDARFDSTTFFGYARFHFAVFSGYAWFESATFERIASFRSARFASASTFALCNFRQHVRFQASHFGADASFGAIRGERGFNMAGAVFEVVPDFIQAHFEEAPRLDNLQVGWKLPRLKELDEEERGKLNKRQRWQRHWLEKSPRYRRVAEGADKKSDLRNVPARWRALKRLAIQGHDTERELEFHARELRSQRFTEDWPLPLAFWRGRAWAGFFRFVSGCFYEWLSDFGRSLARPLLASWLVLIAAAAFFLSQTEALQRGLALQGASYVGGAVQTARHAVANEVPCYTPPPPVEVWRERWPWLHRSAPAGTNAATATNPSHIDGLIEPFRGQTGARAEALHLAVRNAFVVLDGSGEAAHRTFGCLYGVELYGGSTPMAIVPSAVSTVSAAQKLFSALMIFLFGLALRNMLKMK
jgi:hypothetical protein